MSIDIITFALEDGACRGGTAVIGTLSTGNTTLFITYQTISYCLFSAGAIHASLWVNAIGPNVAIFLATIASCGHPKVHSNIN